ncbi:MAG: hypothetical protein ABR578_08675 [Chromatocurvus sp.]
MSNEGYHEPINELSAGTRDMHRDIVSVIEWIRRQDPKFDSELRDYRFTDRPITHE